MADASLAKLPRGVKNILGRKFAKLTVIAFVKVDSGFAIWRCDCECGGTKDVRANCLKSGNVQSCGCMHLKHGLVAIDEYGIWADMIQRCENPNRQAFPDYGGRGIAVCESWHDFRNFFADVGPRPFPNYTLDRVDNNGNYEPGNVQWATRGQQARNRRSNHLITISGTTKCLAEWAEEFGIHWRIVKDRLRRGWSVERALSTPKLR